MSKVIWLPEALSDLVRLFDFLKLQNESIAFQAAQAIREAGFSLANMPYKGTAFGDGSERRKLIVPFGKYGYVIHYSLEDDTILVLPVYHGRENRPH
ncbi:MULTISPECIES: type II toxin-antitoxin system RelE/ParE family toxin [unclassified Nostoc]|uniref:type II toxin-antitoxin system RelE/ParE family toxin n=1 Tax=unclassified Nostoc TaxID=2593658 RepID=UPI001DC1C44A|nr:MULTISPECIES: type II toxin-antitoxin system RelE/ParE family toxin [unclassified Nostoc]MBN3881223.1 type II toxin-antitoxin system RelE/ParE family toxin [Nostoc sp. JL23]MBN3889883.1 type II toxin-antitoxin system RelE/ParE family toxin [Nostoc sp. JL31]